MPQVVIRLYLIFGLLYTEYSAGLKAEYSTAEFNHSAKDTCISFSMLLFCNLYHYLTKVKLISLTTICRWSFLLNRQLWQIHYLKNISKILNFCTGTAEYRIVAEYWWHLYIVHTLSATRASDGVDRTSSCHLGGLLTDNEH